MLRTLSLAFVVAAATAGSAVAQSSGRFALGVQGGTTGLGVEAQLQASDYINLRVAGDAFKYDDTFSSRNVDYDGELDFSTFSGFVDLHPFNNSFFVSGGGFVGERSLSVRANSTESRVIQGMTFTAQQIGTLEGEGDFGDFAPFVGLGFNNTFRTGGRIGFKAVIGAAFGQEPDITLRRTGGTPLTGAFAPAQAILDAETRQQELELEEDAEDLKTLPVVQVGLTYRF